MLLYLGDTLVETDNIDLIRTGDIDGELVLILFLHGQAKPLILPNKEVAEAFRFTMSISNSLGIVNVEEIYRDRETIMAGRDAHRKQVETQAQQAVGEAAALEQFQHENATNVGAPPPAPPPPAVGQTPIGGNPTIPTTTKGGNLLVMPTKNKGD